MEGVGQGSCGAAVEDGVDVDGAAQRCFEAAGQAECRERVQAQVEEVVVRVDEVPAEDVGDQVAHLVRGAADGSWFGGEEVCRSVVER